MLLSCRPEHEDNIAPRHHLAILTIQPIADHKVAGRVASLPAGRINLHNCGIQDCAGRCSILGIIRCLGCQPRCTGCATRAVAHLRLSRHPFLAIRLTFSFALPERAHCWRVPKHQCCRVQQKIDTQTDCLRTNSRKPLGLKIAPQRPTECGVDGPLSLILGPLSFCSLVLCLWSLILGPLSLVHRSLVLGSWSLAIGHGSLTPARSLVIGP